MSRTSFCIGNWKMNMSVHEAEAFMQKLPHLLLPLEGMVGLAVPYTLLQTVAGFKNKILIGAQNVSQFDKGAYTGEVSTQMVEEMGASFSLIGHSERRIIFKENNEIVREKVKRCLSSPLIPVLCIGETFQEKKEGHTKKALLHQLKSSLEFLSEKEARKVVVAYEPVWAIGSGLTATPEMVQEVHQEIRQFFAAHFGKGVSEHTKILYGGSVNKETIEDLIKMPDIDGTLIGGASLDVESFAEIINIARKNKV